MFLPNKYTKWYLALMDKRRNCPPDGYRESHHEIPKSLGGSDDETNRVLLTAREHFVAHRLLVKMTLGVDKRRMAFALHLMRNMGSHRPDSRTVEHIRKMYSEMLKGVPRSEETKKKISETVRKFKPTEESKKKISDALKGVPKSESFKKKTSERLKDSERDKFRRMKIRSSLRGHEVSAETRQKISDSWKRKALTKSLKDL